MPHHHSVPSAATARLLQPHPAQHISFCLVRTYGPQDRNPFCSGHATLSTAAAAVIGNLIFFCYNPSPVHKYSAIEVAPRNPKKNTKQEQLRVTPKEQEPSPAEPSTQTPTAETSQTVPRPHSDAGQSTSSGVGTDHSGTPSRSLPDTPFLCSHQPRLPRKGRSSGELQPPGK